MVWHTSKNDAAHAKQAPAPEIFPPRPGVTAQLLPQKKKLWISYEKFQMLKIFTTAFFFLRDTLRYILVKSNGVINHEFAEVYSVRASSPFLPCTGGLCCGSSCGNFRPPYTRADSEIAAPACILAYMKKKKEKGKKSGRRREKKEVGRLWSYPGKKETGNYAEGKILMWTENIITAGFTAALHYKLLRQIVASDYVNV